MALGPWKFESSRPHHPRAKSEQYEHGKVGSFMNEQAQTLSFSNDASTSPAENLLQRLVEAIRNDQLSELHDEILALHPADLGDVLEGLSRDERQRAEAGRAGPGAARAAEV